MTADRRPGRSRRLPRSGEDEGSMALLMMVVLVGVSLCALLVPMIISQDRTTRFDTTRVQALDAAQAGIDVTLGNLRSAVTGGIGDGSKLPCGPISGAVDGTLPAAYSVAIQYFTSDPVRYPGATSMVCSSGYGTYDASSGLVTPAYARLTATGTAGPAVNGSTAGRTLSTTYVFQTNNTNIPGGTIQIHPPATGTFPALCMDAGSATPSLGAPLLMATCSTATPPIPQQVFVYRADLTLQLLSSINTTTYPNGLCLDTSATPPAANNTIMFSKCYAVGSTSTPYTQQWSFNDYAAYQATPQLSSRTTGNLGTPGLCMNVSTQTAPVPAVNLVNCKGNNVSDPSKSSLDPNQSWLPAAAVGAGGTAPPQWNNYGEFGRCIDVIAFNVNANHLQDFPCKQNPYAGAVAWNQKFAAPTIPTGQTSVTGRIYTSPDSGITNYCLTSPGVSGGYVTIATNGGIVTGAYPCGTPVTQQTWTIYGGDKSLPYSTKYTVRDSSSPALCLGLSAPYASETWSAIDVEPCTGASDQKWNAPALLTAPALQNTTEK